jgi:hypothetical protein
MVTATAATTKRPRLLAWQRLDDAWPTLPDAFGLDAAAQRLVRQRLTEAVGRHIARQRSLPPESQRLWETRPRLAQYVRQQRFYANLLHCYALADMPELLATEVSLALEVLETPPGKLGAEVWQTLLELQCQRIGQVYADLRQRIGLVAQDFLQRAFERLV